MYNISHKEMYVYCIEFPQIMQTLNEFLKMCSKSHYRTITEATLCSRICYNGPGLLSYSLVSGETR